MRAGLEIIGGVPFVKGMKLRSGQVWIRGEHHVRLHRIYAKDGKVTVQVRMGTSGRYTKRTEVMALKKLSGYDCHHAE